MRGVDGTSVGQANGRIKGVLIPRLDVETDRLTREIHSDFLFGSGSGGQPRADFRACEFLGLVFLPDCPSGRSQNLQPGD